MKFFQLLIILFAFTACNNSPVKNDFSEGERIISTNMLEQQDAWNTGNLEGFMKHYWHSDSLVFVGSKGLTRGWQQTLDNYKRSYPTTEKMGRLQFTNEVIDVLDHDNAYVIGKWELFRTEDTLSGHYSLLWKQIGGKWVIVADHSS